MFSVPTVVHEKWWRIKYYLTDFDIKSNTFYALILILVACVVLPNSSQILQKLSHIKNKKIIYAIASIMALATCILLAKIVIIPYSEFIYFNF